MVTKIKTGVIADLAVGQGQLAADSVTAAKIVDGAVGAAEIAAGAVDTSELSAGVLASIAAKQSGDIVQTVIATVNAMSTGTTQIPLDDTIPQSSEGTQILTLAITPTNAANILRIQAVVQVGASAGCHVTGALFQDAAANALYAGRITIDAASTGIQLVIDHTMPAGTTSATTFKVRVGPNNATTLTFNGSAGARLYGGVSICSLIISEIKA